MFVKTLQQIRESNLVRRSSEWLCALPTSASAQKSLVLCESRVFGPRFFFLRDTAVLFFTPGSRRFEGRLLQRDLSENSETSRWKVRLDLPLSDQSCRAGRTSSARLHPLDYSVSTLHNTHFEGVCGGVRGCPRLSALAIFQVSPPCFLVDSRTAFDSAHEKYCTALRGKAMLLCLGGCLR